MKTKLLALVLLAGGSVFAQTRFSNGGNTQAYNRSYPTAPTAFSHSGYQVAGRNQQSGGDNNRYENEYTHNGDDQGFKRENAFGFGRDGFQNRGSDRNDIRGHAQNFRQDDRDGNRFDGR